MVIYELKDMKNFDRLPKKGKNLKYYLAGFADGEGSFSVSIKKVSGAKFGWVIDPLFQVYQHKENRIILKLFQRVLNCGKIHPKPGNPDVLVYTVSNRRHLAEKVIPFFEKYKLLSNKWFDFLKFREIVRALVKKKHTKREGFESIVKIVFSMNKGGKFRRYTLKEILLGFPRDHTQGTEGEKFPLG